METDELNQTLEAMRQELHDLREGLDRPWFITALADQLRELNLAPIGRSFQVEGHGYRFDPLETLPYNAGAALAYASTYCGRESNLCGRFYESDCAHFISHCLAAGGVTVTGGAQDARCPAGLCIRAEELAAALYNATTRYGNVKQLNGYEQGRRGDIGFLKRLIEKSHAFLLAGTPSATSAPVFAHSNPHCGDNMESVRIYFGAYYRIE